MRGPLCLAFLVIALSAFVYPQVKIGSGIKIRDVKIGGTPSSTGTATPTPTPTPWPCTDISDAFPGSSLNGAIWTEASFIGGHDPSVVTTVGSGQLTITVPANPGGSIFSGPYTQVSHDLTGGYFGAKVIQIPDNAVSTYDTYIGVSIDSNNWVAIAHEQGNIYALKKVGGANTTVASATYNGATQLYWRIREASGTTYWEVSADALTWSEVNGSAHQSNPIAVTALFYGIITGANSGATHAAAAAIFDDACAE